MHKEEFSITHDVRKQVTTNLARRMVAATDAFILRKCAEHIGQPEVQPEDLLGRLELRHLPNGIVEIVLDGRIIAGYGPVFTSQEGTMLTATRSMFCPSTYTTHPVAELNRGRQGADPGITSAGPWEAVHQHPESEIPPA